MLLYFTAILCSIGTAICWDFIPDRTCATLYSKDNYKGDAFILKYFDQSPNTEKDYRASIKGWWNTSSVQVEDGCVLTICDDTYFMGNCSLVFYGNVSSLSKIRSANCTCIRDCNCENVAFSWNEYARGYIENDCNTCNAKYINFPESSQKLSANVTSMVEYIQVSKGCLMTVYSKPAHKGINTTIDNGITNGRFASHNFFCLRFSFPGVLSKVGTIFFPWWESTNDIEPFQPISQAGLKSMESGRSGRNAYIMLIGSGSLELLGIDGCGEILTGNIRECRISLLLEGLGNVKAELRVIHIEDTMDSFANNGIDWDYKLMMNLDRHLANHEELNEFIPNSVILLHEGNETDFENDLVFQRKLNVINILRPRILDENYSNLIIGLDISKLNASEQRNPEQCVNQIEKMIEKKWAFPKPTAIVTLQHMRWYAQHVNGFEIPNSLEYRPLNIMQNLKRISKKTGDDLGLAIFKEGFRNTDKQPESTEIRWAFNSTDKIGIQQFKDFVVGLRYAHIVSLRKALNKVTKAKNAMEKEFKFQINSLEKKVGKLEQDRVKDSERIKTEVWEKIKADLNKLFE